MRTLIFHILQDDGLTVDHVLKISSYDVYGYENLRPVDSYTGPSIPDLLKSIVAKAPHEGSVGPFTWEWLG